MLRGSSAGCSLLQPSGRNNKRSSATDTTPDFLVLLTIQVYGECRARFEIGVQGALENEERRCTKQRLRLDAEPPTRRR